MKLKSSVCFDDVLLTPRYSSIKSRKEVDVSSPMANISYVPTIPIVASPMDTITEYEMAMQMIRLGGIGVIHRYNTIEEQRKVVSDVCESLINENSTSTSAIAAAIGVSGDYLERAQSLYNAGARILCVDIAHGHHILMKSALQNLRATFGKRVHLMAGNVATLQAFNDLADWGADSIRVGIGGGSICSTRIQTGHGMPTLQSVMDCARSDRDAIMIADGGIKTSGDIVKALAAGADMVMLGSLLSGTHETPGDILSNSTGGYSYTTTTSQDGLVTYALDEEVTAGANLYKSYRGMASKEAQVEWRGYQSSEEGVATTVPYKGPVKPIIDSLVKGIKSGLSYSGVTTIRELQAVAEFTLQSYSGVSESSTHIFNAS
mgnify:FL=1